MEERKKFNFHLYKFIDISTVDRQISVRRCLYRAIIEYRNK